MKKQRTKTTHRFWTGWLSGPLLLGAVLCGCRSPTDFRTQADDAARGIIKESQKKALGHSSDFSLDTPADTLRRRLLIDQALPKSDAASLGTPDVPRIPQWPDPDYGKLTNEPAGSSTHNMSAPLHLTLLDALQVAARSSREYQDQKENVFQAALRLDLERDAFRDTWTGQLKSLFSTSRGDGDRVSGIENNGKIGFSRKLTSGATFTAGVGLDLVKLLTQDGKSALGALADATLSVPLLRGAGRFVVTEPLTQADRNVVYAIYEFERFKSSFAVQIASDYLGVLQQIDQMNNARENYGRLVQSTKRAQRLADAGQLPAVQVDQALQDELSSRNRYISARLNYDRRLDAFKLRLGLPPDAAIELDPAELARQAERAESLIRIAKDTARAASAQTASSTNALMALSEPSREGGGRLEMEPDKAVRIAFANRLDLRSSIGRLLDAQRGTAVAADRLRADLTLLGHGGAGSGRGLGSADQGNAKVNFAKGNYSGSLAWDAPLKRTSERNQYRASLIAFEKAVRSVQEIEDRIKLDVRNELRTLVENRETVVIQAKALDVARRRLDSTTMFLEAGRAQIRDVLDAEAALVSAQNALSGALVSYRVAELQLQRDMDVLEIDETNLWKEYVPEDAQDKSQ